MEMYDDVFDEMYDCVDRTLVNTWYYIILYVYDFREEYLQVWSDT